MASIQQLYELNNNNHALKVENFELTQWNDLVIYCSVDDSFEKKIKSE